MKRLLATLLFLLLPTTVWAQCSGVFPANTVCGNLTGTPNVPTAVPFGLGITGPGSSTQNGLPIWANTVGTVLANGAGQTIAGNYTWGGTATYSGVATFNSTANFTSAFQIGGNAMTFPGVAATLPSLAGNQTFTGNNTFSTGTDNFTGTFQIGGTTLTLPVSVANGGVNTTNPTVQSFTTGSGTYTTPAGVKWIKVKMVAGGGGGSAAVTNPGSNGGDSSFGTWTTIHGVGGGTAQGVGPAGGSGGVNGTGTLIRREAGQNGGVGLATGSVTSGPLGGASALGGAGASTINGGAGIAAVANTGSGGSSGVSAGVCGQSGSGAEYVEFIITSPAATYAYAVGAGGGGGAAGSQPGGNGAAGIIVVEEHYNP